MNPVRDLIDKYYRSLPIGERALEDTIREFMPVGGCMLDAGCGEDAPFARKFSSEAVVVGLDLCQDLPQGMPMVRANLSRLPFTDNAFSMVYSRSVFEHLLEPDKVMDEIHRALKPGGVCVILTPNRYDYSSVVAQLTPQAFHGWFVKRIYGSNTYETFPTFYRANTPRYFKSLTQKRQGWKIRKLVGLRHYPANLIFSRILFRFGVLYDWLIAKLGWSALQPSLLIVLEKKL
jgi:ubiquinone/menaquinone biosynthesis C-methylase UbiE